MTLGISRFHFLPAAEGNLAFDYFCAQAHRHKPKQKLIFAEV
jgi:hypothetical protein